MKSFAFLFVSILSLSPNAFARYELSHTYRSITASHTRIGSFLTGDWREVSCEDSNGEITFNESSKTAFRIYAEQSRNAFTGDALSGSLGSEIQYRVFYKNGKKEVYDHQIDLRSSNLRLSSNDHFICGYYAVEDVLICKRYYSYCSYIREKRASLGSRVTATIAAKGSYPEYSVDDLVQRSTELAKQLGLNTPSLNNFNVLYHAVLGTL